MIVTGGENVHSIEVENAPSSHPAVAQVALIGIPHDVWREQVHAIVVLNHAGDAGRALEDELREHVKGSIAAHEAPKSFEFRTEPIPLSGALKPMKRELRRLYGQGRVTALH